MRHNRPVDATIRRELSRVVRAKNLRVDSSALKFNDGIALYGAEQALRWVLGQDAASPTGAFGGRE